MKKELSLIEISDDKPIIEWADKLMGEFNTDAIESIRRENVMEETVFLLEIEGKKYIAFFIESEDKKDSDQTMKVNQKHREIMKSIRVSRIDSTLLYSLETSKDGSDGVGG